MEYGIRVNDVGFVSGHGFGVRYQDNPLHLR